MKWKRLGFAIVLVAAVLRLAWPELRPPHHDEASNWIHLGRVASSGVYRFDPSNYHGPSYFYLTVWARWAPAEWRLTALRLPIMLVGIGMVPMVLALRRRWGPSAVAAAAMLAISPAAVFYARDSIHETLLAAATLAAFVAAGRPTRRGALALGVALGLMVATKETVVLTFAAWGAALGVAWLMGARFTLPPWRPALGAAVGTVLVFYSAYGRRPGDLLKLVPAVMRWTERGNKGEGHQKPWDTFWLWLGEAEGAPLALAALGAAVGLRRRSPLDAGLLVWTAAVLVAYSAIPYKTPWCALQITLPLALLAGRGLWFLVESGLPGRALAGLAVVVTLGQAIEPSFFRYDDQDHPYVYVQTDRQAVQVAADIRAAAEVDEDVQIRWFLHTRIPFSFLTRLGLPQEGTWPDDVDGDVVVTRAKDALAFHSRATRPYLHRRFLFRQGEKLDLWIAPELEPHLPPRERRLVEPRGDFEPPPPPARTAPGWAVTYALGKLPGAEPHHREVRERASLSFPDDHAKPQWAPHRLTWEAWTRIDASGVHGISVDSDDGVDLWIEGRLVLGNDGSQGPRKRVADVHLEPGWVHVRIVWADFGGPARFELQLTEPGAFPKSWPAHRTVHDASFAGVPGDR